jgi:hypothetical protein
MKPGHQHLRSAQANGRDGGWSPDSPRAMRSLGMALVLGSAWFAALANGRIKKRGSEGGDPPHLKQGKPAARVHP